MPYQLIVANVFFKLHIISYLYLINYFQNRIPEVNYPLSDIQ